MNRTGKPGTLEVTDDLALGAGMDLQRLLWQLDHAREVIARDLESRFGFTSQQRTVLRLIGRFPGITASRLAGMLHIHPSSLTRLLGALIEQQLVVGSEDPRDRRRQRLGLTAAGRRFDVPLAGTVESGIQRLFSRVSPSDMETFQQVLELLVEELDEPVAVARAGAGSFR